MRTQRAVQHLPVFCVVLYLLTMLQSMPARSQTLAGYWNFDAGTGTTAADSSGAGNNGTLINSPLWITGVIGDALEFPSGTSAYVAVPPGASLANLYTNGMTVAAWIKPHSSGGAALGRIVDKDNNNGGWFLAMHGANTVRFAVDEFPSQQPSRVSTSIIQLDEWQHVAATWDGSIHGANIHLYVNGVLADGATLDGAGVAQSDADTPLAIGNRSLDLARGFDGAIDEVRVYNGVLTAAQIQALAQLKGQPPTIPTGLSATQVTASSITLGWTASTGQGGTEVAGYYIYRNGKTTSPIATVTSGTSFTDSGLASGTTYTYQVAAFDTALPPNVSAPSAALQVTTQSPSALSGTNIGSATPPGSVSANAGTYTVKGAGVDIWNTVDSFELASEPFTGNGSITARVVSQTDTNAWAKAGVMFRETLAPNSRMAAALVSAANGSLVEARTATGGATVGTHGPAVKAPYWVRLVRMNTSFTGYTSADGHNWSAIGTYVVPMATPIYAGIAVTSHNNGTLSTAVFDNVVITSQPQVSIAPASALLTVGATQQFTATVINAANTGVSWQVDGVDGGSPQTGTISPAGLYTAPTAVPASPTTYTITAVSMQDSTVSASAQAIVRSAATAGVDVTTYKYDLNRSGLNSQEATLTPANVRSATFGLLRLLPGDGRVFAEPLYLSNLKVAGSLHNVAFVATEHNSVYAYDADTGTKLWQSTLTPSGETTSDERACDVVVPEIGITATPVIDRTAGSSGAIYLVAATKDAAGHYHQRLHALDVTTGSELFNGPTEIAATYPTAGGGTTVFDPAAYLERAGLLLLNGEIYTTWASHCDNNPYTGWIIAFSETTLARTRILNVAPNSNNLGPAIWMSGGAPAVDSNGNIFLLTANGVFETTLDANGFPSGQDYGNSFLKISTANGGLTVLDYFTMSNEVSESNPNIDLDLGAGGALLLPDLVDGSGLTRHLALGAGKDGNIYVVNRDSMGRFNPSKNAIWQELNGLLGQIRSTPAYFEGRVYLSDRDAALKAFTITDAKLSSAPTSQSTNTFGYPGTIPVVSANGTANAIVWAATVGNPGVLYAYDATNLATQLYNSTQAANGRDAYGVGNRFTAITVVNGKVFVGTEAGVAELGLLH